MHNAGLCALQNIHASFGKQWTMLLKALRKTSLVFGETEEWPGELTRIQQEDAEKKEIARRKRHFIVNVQKGTDDYIHTHTCTYFQMTRGGEAATPKTPDPDEEWSKREWEKAMAKWRNQLKQWERNARNEEERVEEANTEEDRYIAERPPTVGF